ncbi:uncharacterized protein EDB93DRAFT_630359 [Suillus bovinus]|uniref:uncharacterized protein n=1 Tax=Suillus bovinus TaxID=48563 RepID=UPI001B86D5FE|nr:uncharacterized protein EDB93DRAFT_630359 [Suillus bovinus]KAG2141381.1 hypothetical protein EDB93DRAFT_630359 [Suillus bovinus]
MWFVSYLSTAAIVYNLKFDYSPLSRQPNRLYAKIERNIIVSVLQPLVGCSFSALILNTMSVHQVAKGSLFAAAAHRIIQTGIATIIVLEYSAFLPNNLKTSKRVESAVDYYLKSPTVVAVEKGAQEISHQTYKKEELKQKILDFILQHRISKDLTAKK